MSSTLLYGRSWSLISLHLFFWLVYSYVLATLYLTQDIRVLEVKEPERWMLFTLRLGLELSIFYSLYAWAIPSWLARGKVFRFIGLVAILLVVPTIVRTQFSFWWQAQPGFGNPLVTRDAPLYTQYLARGLSTLFVITMAGMGRFTFDWFRGQRERQELENQRLTSELAYLKSQVNPHFLFNTLNNIYALARKKSEATEDAVLKLSGLMRYMLYETNETEVSLSREINQLEDYLSLQSLRYAREGVAKLEVIGDSSNYKIAPLLLVPLVENGFKHGRFSKPEDVLMIFISIDEEKILFRTTNSTSPNLVVQDESGGVGLENIRRRLSLLYPNRHELDIHEEDGLFTATLTLRWL